MNQNQVRELNAAIEAVKDYPVENVYFVACGGSKAIFDPAQYIFDREGPGWKESGYHLLSFRQYP